MITTYRFPSWAAVCTLCAPTGTRCASLMSSNGNLRPVYCLAAPRAREARRRGGVRDGARRRQKKSNPLSQRHCAPSSRCPAAAATKAYIAALASDACLIPEKPAAWEELPRRNLRWRVLRTGRLSRAYFASVSLWKLEA